MNNLSRVALFMIIFIIVLLILCLTPQGAVLIDFIEDIISNLTTNDNRKIHIIIDHKASLKKEEKP